MGRVAVRRKSKKAQLGMHFVFVIERDRRVVKFTCMREHPVRSPLILRYFPKGPIG